MISLSFTWLVAVVAMSLCVAGCGGIETYFDRGRAA
jgi:hypothetical protein